MTSRDIENRSARVLIHAPFGRDGILLRDVLARAGIEAEAYPAIEAMHAGLREGAAAMLIGDEGLTAARIEYLHAVLSEQAPWSDLPVFVMTRPMENGYRYSFLKRLHALGNVSLLDRPLRAETIVSTFQMALRARSRQYDIRDYLEAERQSAEKLARANAELRRANEDLNQFAFSVSHDLQEPLRMVAVYTQILQREFGSELHGTASDYMNFAILGAKRIQELLKDLLSYVQVLHSSGDDLALTDANRVLQEALDNLRGSIGEVGATVESGRLPVLVVKPVHLLQLFLNLIGNALKYRNEAETKIYISAERNNGEWRFNVRDNGIGIEPRYAHHIFGVFKRLHSGHEKYEGTGIGLAICQKIVERYGGRIWVESEGAGKGSLFSFTLPARENGAH